MVQAGAPTPHGPSGGPKPAWGSWWLQASIGQLGRQPASPAEFTTQLCPALLRLLTRKGLGGPARPPMGLQAKAPCPSLGSSLAWSCALALVVGSAAWILLRRRVNSDDW
jgi:hypothetical protein